MEVQWFRQDKQAVLDELRRGRAAVDGHDDGLGAAGRADRPAHRAGRSSTPSIASPSPRQRAGIDDALLFRTLATLPFLPEPGLDPSARLLFREPAILLQLGWAPAQIQAGDNHRHRHPEGRQAESLPCHPDTLRDAFRRVEAAAWLRAQEAGVAALYRRRLVRGKVYAIDGSGLGNDFRLVCLVCVSAQRPVIVAWRLLEGAASEKGREAEVTRELIEQALELGGPDCIELLLADALYADGPLIAWLAYEKGIDVLAPLPSDRLMFADALGLARGGLAGVDAAPLRADDPGPQAGADDRGGGRRRDDQLGQLRRGGAGLRGGRPEPVGGLGPRGRAAGAAAGGLLGAGEHAAVRRRLRGVAGVPSALAHRERRLPGAEGGLRAGGAAVGAGRRGGALPHDADDPGVQHGAGLPESGRRTAGEAGDPPPASSDRSRSWAAARW